MSLVDKPTALTKFPVATVSNDNGVVHNVYISENAAEGVAQINTQLDERCMLAPTRDPQQIDCVWLFAAAGAGKSQWVRFFIVDNNKIWGKKGPIVLVSQLDEDETLPMHDALDIKRIDVKTLLAKPFELSEMDGYEGRC